MPNIQYLLGLVTAIIELLFFSGLVFGWSSINYVLKKEGYFSYLCENTSDDENLPSNQTELNNQSAVGSFPQCKSQSEKLNLVFTIASFSLSLFTLPNGYIFDKFGTWISRFIAISLLTLGYILLSISSINSSLLLFPAMCGFSIGGILLLLTNMQLSNLFPKFKSSIITLMNGSLDSSSVVFLLVKLCYDSGISFSTIFQFMAYSTVYLWIRTVFFMPRRHVPYPVPSSGYKFGLHDCLMLTQSEKSLKVALEVCEAEKPRTCNVDIDVAKTHSLWGHVKTLKFWMNLLHFSILQLRNYFFLSSFYTWIVSILPENEQDQKAYLNVFGICQFFGVFFAPLNGALIDFVKWRNRAKANKKSVSFLAIAISTFVTSSWGVVFSVLLLIPIPELQYVSFISQVAFRSFLYGGNASFIALMFPVEHFGKLYGLTMTLGGVISLLQFPLNSLVLYIFEEDFLIINIICLVLCMISYLHPVFLYVNSKKMVNNVQDDEDGGEKIFNAEESEKFAS